LAGDGGGGGGGSGAFCEMGARRGSVGALSFLPDIHKQKKYKSIFM
jgi:hypothetical protein